MSNESNKYNNNKYIGVTLISTRQILMGPTRIISFKIYKSLQDFLAHKNTTKIGTMFSRYPVSNDKFILLNLYDRLNNSQ